MQQICQISNFDISDILEKNPNIVRCEFLTYVLQDYRIDNKYEYLTLQLELVIKRIKQE